MSDRPRFHWFLPMRGDGPAFRPGLPRRTATTRYLGDVARAAENNGFESLLIATSHASPDTWLAAAAAAHETERIRFIVAFRAGYTLPTLTAQMVETFHDLFPGRLDVNVVTGSEGAEQSAYGDRIDKAERYARTAEFLDVLTRELDGEPFDYDGRFYQVSGGGRPRPIGRRPRIYFGGLSPESASVSARYADVQLSYGETPPMVAEHVQRLNMLAAEHRRRLEFGIRIHVISRDTADEARAETERILATFDPDEVAQRQRTLATRASVGQQRVQSLNPGSLDQGRLDPDSLWPHPNVWSGPGLVAGGGASTAIVGSHDEVAERIVEYAQAGIGHFIVSWSPLLEEAYRFGEFVTPRVRRLLAGGPPDQPSDRDASNDEANLLLAQDGAR